MSQLRRNHRNEQTNELNIRTHGSASRLSSYSIEKRHGLYGAKINGMACAIGQLGQQTTLTSARRGQKIHS